MPFWFQACCRFRHTASAIKAAKATAEIVPAMTGVESEADFDSAGFVSGSVVDVISEVGTVVGTVEVAATDGSGTAAGRGSTSVAEGNIDYIAGVTVAPSACVV